MAYCTKCNKEIESLGIECPHCGYNFTDIEQNREKFRYKFIRYTTVSLFLFSIFSYHIFSISYKFQNLGEQLLSILLIPIYIPFFPFFISTSNSLFFRLADDFTSLKMICVFTVLGLLGSFFYSWILFLVDKNLSATSVTGTFFPSKSLIKFFIICIFIIFASLFIKFYPEYRYYDQSMHKISCKNNLKQIGLALRIYADNYDDKFPPSGGDKGFKQLMNGMQMSMDSTIYLCPTVKYNNRIRGQLRNSDNSFFVDYEYRGGLTDSSPADTPIVWDKQNNHKNSRNVLFVNGRVKEIADKEWKERFYNK